jgi:hypothetical protein
MHDALEVVAERKRRGVIDFWNSAINSLCCDPKVIVEVCRDDPDSICTAKEANNGFVKVVRVGVRIPTRSSFPMPTAG